MGVDHRLHRYSGPCCHLHGTPHVKDGECFGQIARRCSAGIHGRGRPDDVRRRQSCIRHVLRCLWIRISRPEFLHSGPWAVPAGGVLPKPAVPSNGYCFVLPHVPSYRGVCETPFRFGCPLFPQFIPHRRSPRHCHGKDVLGRATSRGEHLCFRRRSVVLDRIRCSLQCGLLLRRPLALLRADGRHADARGLSPGLSHQCAAPGVPLFVGGMLGISLCWRQGRRLLPGQPARRRTLPLGINSALRACGHCISGKECRDLSCPS
mmetsp:Transcript_121187/g.287865  ORF Transcript_121187/g.287865 Transcript_121187/m.287865 type:complete len:263 (-) Transcript_121187:445-1233(-)